MSKLKASKNSSVLHRSVAGLVASLLLLPAWSVYAAVPEQPNAGRILQDTQQTEKKLPEQKNPSVEMARELRPPMTAQEGLKVWVKSYRITGQTLFQPAELQALLADYVNKEVTHVQMLEAANQLANFFHAKGYLVAQVYLPVQEIDHGLVEIAVVVGQYGEIILKNQSSVRDGIIRDQLRGLQSGSYIHNSQLERAALLAGDLAGVTTQLALAPGKLPGTTNIIVEVQDAKKPLQSSLSINNWGNRFTGSIQTTYAASFSNSTQNWGDRAAVSISSTGSGQMTGNLNWQLPVGEGSKLSFGYSKVKYQLGEDFNYLDASGTAYTKHVDWTYALQRSRDTNWSLQLSYDHKTLADLIDLNATSTHKKSHSTGVGLSGDSSDKLWGGGYNGYSLTWYRGGLSGESTKGDTIAPSAWEKTMFSFLRQQYISDKLTFFASFSGQWASTNLDTSERFSLGGANGVRAYPLGEASGDEAWLFTGELRWTLPSKGSKRVTQLIAFYDAGVSHIEKNPAAVEQNRRSIAGAGVGINYMLPGEYTLKASYAWKTGSEAARSDTDRNGRLWIQGIRLF